MNFLKTLLIYMTLTMAMSVQDAPAPGMEPEPTPVPDYVLAQSIGTATPTAEPSATPTAAPKAEATSRNTPSITPNTKYKTIQYGDRGNDVRKLQKRLIELGYMKKGSDDGSYGYQTLNAVREFQRVNGLSVDGAAGRYTLTCLYEDPHVIPNPSAATPTAAPTEAPAQPSVLPETAAAPVETEAQPTGATEETPDAQTPSDPAEPLFAPSVTESWQRLDNASVILNGAPLFLLQRTGDVITQRKPAVWLRDGLPVVSLDDLVAAAGDWKQPASDIAQAQLLLFGYQIDLTAVGPTASGTCDTYAALCNAAPVLLSDGDIVCSRGHWYAALAFFVKTVSASSSWDADEQTLVLLIQDRTVAEAKD